MSKSNDKKTLQLGMPVGTATSRLRKIIIFNFLKRFGENVCYQCAAIIESEAQLSIEHKEPYLDSKDPLGLFFDLNNIAFSHLSCNVGAARRTRIMKHPSHVAYQRGCRCEECKAIQAALRRSERARGIKT